jgi:hypothetical protein
MNTIARKLTLFVLMAAAATTALTIGATTTFAASNTHTPQFQLMGNDYSWASSFTHTPINLTGNVGSDDRHVADWFSPNNSNSTAGSDARGGFNSAQNGSSDNS